MLKLDRNDFYRAKLGLGVARYCQDKLSVSLSVCDVDRGIVVIYRFEFIPVSLKIISRLISLTLSLSADPNMTDLNQREHPQILAGIGVG